MDREGTVGRGGLHGELRIQQGRRQGWAGRAPGGTSESWQPHPKLGSGHSSHLLSHLEPSC